MGVRRHQVPSVGTWVTPPSGIFQPPRHLLVAKAQVSASIGGTSRRKKRPEGADLPKLTRWTHDIAGTRSRFSDSEFTFFFSPKTLSRLSQVHRDGGEPMGQNLGFLSKRSKISPTSLSLNFLTYKMGIIRTFEEGISDKDLTKSPAALSYEDSPEPYLHSSGLLHLGATDIWVG